MATTMRARIQTLDIIRGVAVMGILAMNIYAFAGPGGMYFNPSAYGGDTGLNWFAWAFNFVLLDSKMRGLFSIMFGASTLLVIERATAKSDRPALRHYSRMIWLALFGLMHFYFIWWGDILFLYAGTGLLVFLWRNRSVKILRNWGIAFLALSYLLLAMNWAGMAAYQAGAIPAEQAEGLGEAVAAINGDFGSSPARVAEMLDLYRSDYSTIVEYRTGELLYQPISGLAMMLPETLGLMLIGMALFKSGFLTGEWPRERYAKWARNCFLIGIPPLIALLYWQVSSGYDGVTVFGVTMAHSMPFDVIMAIGWAALITWLAKAAIESQWSKRFAATGRMAFTNYLATSVVMTTIFYGYGLGLFGEIGRAALYLFVFGMWALMLLWSKPWLDRFHYGPLEWIWRTLSRFSPQPMVKTA